MSDDERLRAELGDAVSGADSALAAADLLCQACVGLLDVDGAAISLTLGGAHRGTLGASSTLSRRLDAFQFTFGEGPCLDAVRSGGPVLAGDLNDPAETRWPAFTGSVLQAGVTAVFALPVALSRQPIGALDLFRNLPGPLSERAMTGGLLAAELAAVPLLDLLAAHGQTAGSAQVEDGWDQLSALQRVEVYQATGMIMGALDVDPTEALVRLRAHAFARDMTAGEAALAIVERRISLESTDWSDPTGPPGTAR